MEFPDEEPLELPILEEEPSPKKGGRKGRQSAPAKLDPIEFNEDEEI